VKKLHSVQQSSRLIQIGGTNQHGDNSSRNNFRCTLHLRSNERLYEKLKASGFRSIGLPSDPERGSLMNRCEADNGRGDQTQIRTSDRDR
jgi:hypothetical protein